MQSYLYDTIYLCNTKFLFAILSIVQINRQIEGYKMFD